MEHDLIVTFKTKHKLTIWHSGCTLGIYPSEMTRPQKTWLIVHTSFIYSSPKLYQPKCPALDKWLNKLVHPYREVLYQQYYKKELTVDTRHNLDSSQQHYAEPKSQSQKATYSMIPFYDSWNYSDGEQISCFQGFGKAQGSWLSVTIETAQRRALQWRNSSHFGCGNGCSNLHGIKWHRNNTHIVLRSVSWFWYHGIFMQDVCIWAQFLKGMWGLYVLFFQLPLNLYFKIKS